MSNRILLNNSGLKISRPSIDVLTASEGDLIFDSDWSQLAIHMRGSLTLGSTSSVNFGKTFANIPLVCLRLNNAINGLGSRVGTIIVNDSAIWYPESFGDTGYWSFTMRTSATSFTVSTQGSINIGISYVVWDFDL